MICWGHKVFSCVPKKGTPGDRKGIVNFSCHHESSHSFHPHANNCSMSLFLASEQPLVSQSYFSFSQQRHSTTRSVSVITKESTVDQRGTAVGSFSCERWQRCVMLMTYIYDSCMTNNCIVFACDSYDIEHEIIQHPYQDPTPQLAGPIALEQF